MKYIDEILNRLVIGVGAAFITVLLAMIISLVGWVESFVALAVVLSAMPFAGRSRDGEEG